LTSWPLHTTGRKARINYRENYDKNLRAVTTTTD
jgi:hypothetical protein